MVDAPTARHGHSAAWAGTKMIVWGGVDGAGVEQDTGADYNPVTKTWSAIAADTDSPSARYDHVAVWTDNKMIVWGGVGSAVKLDSGNLYDPVANTWSLISTADAPTGRTGMSAVWTGTKMFVWGGNDSAVTNTGGLYDPVANTWSSTSTVHAPSARAFASAVKGGNKVYVWGGQLSVGSTDSGAVYDPSTDKWASIDVSDTDHPSAREKASAIWTGTKLIIWGGENQSTAENTGAVTPPAACHKLIIGKQAPQPAHLSVARDFPRFG